MSISGIQHPEMINHAKFKKEKIKIKTFFF